MWAACIGAWPAALAQALQQPGAPAAEGEDEAEAEAGEAPEIERVPDRSVPQKVDPEVPERHATPRPSRPSFVSSPGPLPLPTDVPSPDSAAARRHREASTKRSAGAEELIRRSQTDIDFYELCDEMLDEIAHQLAKQDPALLSPLAVRTVRVSPNIRPEFARTLEARLVARIANATNIKLSTCVECGAMRSRVEDGQWVVTLGAVRQDDLRRIGESQGIKAFADLGFTFNHHANVIWMEASVFRASDGGMVWTDAYRSDGTTAVLLRTGRRIPSRAERAEELDLKLRGKPDYGYMVSFGMAQLGYDGPTGNIAGGMATLRLHERFGEGQSRLFGLSAGVFTSISLLNSILLGAYYSQRMSKPNLNQPELWAYGEAGGMFSGNQGNTFYVEGGLDLHLKWRLSLVTGVMYVVPTHFANYDLGGAGYRLRIAMNW